MYMSIATDHYGETIFEIVSETDVLNDKWFTGWDDYRSSIQVQVYKFVDGQLPTFITCVMNDDPE